MKGASAYLVFKKDWREIRRNWQIILPILLVPIAFSTIFPLLIGSVPKLALSQIQTQTQLEALLRNIPRQIGDNLSGMNAPQVLFYVMSVYFYAPLFLMIPVMASSVIASDSFAGEKERKTIEPLLATPLLDSELFLGKILVSFTISMTVTFLSFIVYTLTVNYVSMQLLNGIAILPNSVWIILVFGFAPMMAATCIGLTVTISAWVRGFREAQQISIVLVLPILGLMFGQLLGIFILEPRLVGAMTGVFALVNTCIFYYGAKTFNREEILSKHV